MTSKPILKILLLLLGYAMHPHLCTSQVSVWQKQTRLNFGLIHDSNIFEAEIAPLSSQGAQTSLFFKAAKTGSKTALIFDFLGGLIIYNGHPVENRISQSLGGRINVKLSKNSSLSLKTSNRLKYYFNTVQGFNHFQFSPQLGWKIKGPLILTPLLNFESISYNRTSHYDYRIFSSGILLHARLAYNTSLSMQISYGRHKYSRRALTYSKSSSWQKLKSFQQDTFSELLINLEHYSWALFRLSAGLRRQDSNSFGFSFIQPLIRFSAARSMGRGFVCAIYGSFHKRFYLDDLKQNVHIRPGLDVRENTYLLIDISRRLKANLTANIRAGRYLDESPLAAVYYKKNLFLVGLSQTF